MMGKSKIMTTKISLNNIEQETNIVLYEEKEGHYFGEFNFNCCPELMKNYFYFNCKLLDVEMTGYAELQKPKETHASQEIPCVFKIMWMTNSENVYANFELVF
jgi:hypothetical protein